MNYIDADTTKYSRAATWASKARRTLQLLQESAALSEQCVANYAAYKATLSAQEQSDTGAAAKSLAQSQEAAGLAAMARLIADHADATDQLKSAVLVKLTAAVNGL